MCPGLAEPTIAFQRILVSQLENWLPNSRDLNPVDYLVGGVATDSVLSQNFRHRSAEMRANGLSVSGSANPREIKPSD